MRPGLTTLVTYRPDGSQARCLAQFGHLSPPVYSYMVPGGCDQLSATFARPPRFRTDALDPGRLVRAYRGGAVVWSGILDEPVPSSTGWGITAHGAGTFGNDYRAIWTGTWGTGTPDQVVNNAIGRGLNWVNPGIGSPAGMWVGQVMDSGSNTVTDVLNNACTKGGLTWIVNTTDTGANVLSLIPLPVVANRLLIVGDPVARTVALGPSTLYVRYQTSPDNGKNAATYAITSVTQPVGNREGVAGRVEDYMDLSSAGQQTATQAQAPASAVLQKFRRVAFTGQMTAMYGQLRTLGGTRADPGCYLDGNMTAMVCKLLLADYTPVADVITGPPSLLIGSYQWDDAAMTATLAPAESIRTNFSSLMQMIAGDRPHRTRPTHRHHKALHH